MGIRRFLGKLFGRKTTSPLVGQPTSRKALDQVRREKGRRDTSARFYGERLKKFMAGDAIDIYTSDMVRIAEWSEDAGLLKTTFNNGGYRYYPCNRQEAKAFALAPSKGGFLHDQWISKGIKGSK